MKNKALWKTENHGSLGCEICARDSILVHSQEMLRDNNNKDQTEIWKAVVLSQSMPASMTTNLEALSAFDLRAWAWHEDPEPEAFQQWCLS